MLHRVRHANLVAVLGCCRDSPDVQMILMEYHQLFNLKSHLLSTSSSQPWSLAQIQSATLQIATGMNALAQKRFVHRDLGTRNILVGFHGKDNQRVCSVHLMRRCRREFTSNFFFLFRSLWKSAASAWTKSRSTKITLFSSISPSLCGGFRTRRCWKMNIQPSLMCGCLPSPYGSCTTQRNNPFQVTQMMSYWPNWRKRALCGMLPSANQTPCPVCSSSAGHTTLFSGRLLTN